MKSIFSVLFVFILFSGYAQKVANPVKWEYSYEVASATEGSIIIKATIDDKWHIYSQKQEGDGPIPTSFKFESSSDYSTVGVTEEPEAEKVYSEVFGSDVVSFSKEVIFKQKIKLNTKKGFVVKGALEYMSCNDNMCLPPKTIEFTVAVPAK